MNCSTTISWSQVTPITLDFVSHIVVVYEVLQIVSKLYIQWLLMTIMKQA